MSPIHEHFGSIMRVSLETTLQIDSLLRNGCPANFHGDEKDYFFYKTLDPKLMGGSEMGGTRCERYC